MREVVRGDKHNLRKTANCKAQISTMGGVNDTDLCVAICIFSGCVCHLEQLHAQSPFLFPIVFSINVSLFHELFFPISLFFFFLRSFRSAEPLPPKLGKGSPRYCTCGPGSFSRHAWFRNPDFHPPFSQTDDGVDAETFLLDF